VSIFQASAGVGIIIGSVLAGILATSLGWRRMFSIFGAAGLVLVLLIIFTMRLAARTSTDKRGPLYQGGVLATLGAILSVPGLGWLAVGYAVSNMMMACLPIWAPAFLLRSHGVQLDQVGAVVGPPAVLGGVVGTIFAGILATRLIQRSNNRFAGLIVPIVSLPLAAPAFAVFLFSPSIKAVMIAIALMNFMLSSSLGPCVALAVSLVPAARRGLTSTLMLTVQTLIAFALAPLIIGIASDALTPHYGEEALRYALALMLLAPLAASLLLWWARRQLYTSIAQ
jgi:MFS family permease